MCGINCVARKMARCTLHVLTLVILLIVTIGTIAAFLGNVPGGSSLSFLEKMHKSLLIPSQVHCIDTNALDNDVRIDLPGNSSLDVVEQQFSQCTSWQGAPVIAKTAKFYGQSGEDEYAYNHFFHKTLGGSYMELGAFDGVLFSNTRWFHLYLAWRGVLIEGSPVNYPKVIKSRPFDVKVHSAICAVKSQVHYVVAPRGAVNGIYEFMPDSYKLRWNYSQLNDTSNLLVKVQCLPLSYILGLLRIRHIDFFSLDVEGGELKVLKSLNFDCVRFNVILVEAPGDDPTKERDVVEFLAGKGYKHYSHVAQNDWFVRAGWLPSKAPGIKR